MINNRELLTRFTYHAPIGNQIQIYENIRQEALTFAEFVRDNTPECREQTIAIAQIEQAVFWANAAVAREG